MSNESPDNIAQLLEKLAEGADAIVAHPGAVADLEAAGVRFDPPEDLAPEEFLDRLFEKRREAASTTVARMPNIPQNIQPNLGLLYNEIVECVLFGLYGAAITLCGILVEFALKQATYRAELGEWSYDAERWDEFERMTFRQAIGRASSASLLTTAVETELLRFKDNVRNPYSHYNIKKITSGVVAGKVGILDTSTRKVQVRDIRVRDEPALHAPAKAVVDAHLVIRVLAFAASVLRYLFSKDPRS